MKNKTIYAFLAITTIAFAGCGKKQEANDTSTTKSRDTANASSISEESEFDVDIEVEPQRNMPECFHGKSVDEFIEYLNYDGVSEGPHKKTNYVSEYDGPYEKVLGDDERYIFDNRELPKYCKCESVDINDVKNTLDNNKYLDDNLKDFIYDYVIDMTNYYPDLDLQILNYVLKSLEVECVDSDYFSSNVLANYSSDKRIIRLVKGIDLSENTSGIISLRHELGHALTMTAFNHENELMEIETIYAKFEGENRYGKTVNEVLNTLFTTEPFLDRYDEETSEFIGYIVSANTFRALFKLLPEDIYIENVFKNNVYYFETYFDSYYSGSLTAAEFFKLYDDYYKDFEAGRYEDALEKMRRIFHFVAENYVRVLEDSDFTADEIDKIREALKNRLSKYAPDYSAEFYLDALDEVDIVFDSID